MPNDFDEAAYLKANLDVAAAVAAGDIPSGLFHYENFGRKEGRLIARTAEEKLRAVGFQGGARHYRAFVGAPEHFDVMAALQFKILTDLGLREDHYLLDVGCGSLRAGRLFIPYLLPGRYSGIEPEGWLVEEGIDHELGRDILSVKMPQFCNDSECSFDHFGHRFDYVLIQSVLTHSPLGWIQRCAERLARVLALAGGLVIATFAEGEEDYEGTEWRYPGVVSYRRETLKNVFGSSGLTLSGLDYEHPRDLAWFTLGSSPA